MNEYGEELVFETKMDHIAEHIEEMVLDAMLSALKKIKERSLLQKHIKRTLRVLYIV